MTVVHLPAVLRAFAGGAGTVEASGATLRALVMDLERQYPPIAGRVVDAVGLRPEVFVAINNEEAFGLDDQVPAGAAVYILLAIAGGASGLPSQNHGSAPARLTGHPRG